MNNELWFKKHLEKYKDDEEFITEKLIIQFTEKIVSRMNDLNISRVELAKRLGVSKALITKILNGNPNLTIKTMVSLAKALNCNLDIDLCPIGFETRKFYISKRDDIINTNFINYLPDVSEEINASAA